MVKRMKKVFPINIVTNRNLFLQLRMNSKINNSFAMKNEKISHFENFNHASHLNEFYHHSNFFTGFMMVHSFVFYYFCFSREYCEIFKNIYFEKHLRTTVSEV